MCDVTGDFWDDVADSYKELSEGNLGWCTECDDITRDSTEPDAMGYKCPKCKQETVIGADTFLMNCL